MSIETLDDIIEEILNKFGVYGVCETPLEGCEGKCRACLKSSLNDRIRNAIKTEDLICPHEPDKEIEYLEWIAHLCSHSEKCPVKKDLHCYTNKPCFK